VSGSLVDGTVHKVNPLVDCMILVGTFVLLQLLYFVVELSVVPAESIK
jgi:hypothetical protein